MALLTDPSGGYGKHVKFLINYKGIFSIILYISGVIWFVVLAHKPFNDGTYFSENALLPGLVLEEFNEDETAKQLYTELKEKVLPHSDAIPHDWLMQKFNEINIEAYSHSFTLIYPLIANKTYLGQNVYAILRAPRSSSLEGIVVSAPFRGLNSIYSDSTASLALMLSLAKFCRRHKYWAKDIIFLITDHEQLGMQAWLEAYHNAQFGNGILNSSNLIARAGSLQAAINLEIHSTKISHIDVKVEGLNGQLPNLDLVNLVHKLCKKQGVRHTFKNRRNPNKKDTIIYQWLHSLKTLFSMIWMQASCVPNGNHGLYHRFGIEAVTLEGHKPQANHRKQISGMHQTGRVLEGILRSLNNLLERFHQSYFFYLLPSNDRFVSIGTYMIALSFIGSPLIISGLVAWLNLYKHFKPKGIEKNGENHQKELSKKKSNGSDSKELRFTNIGLLLLVSHFIGWLFTNSPVCLSKIGFTLWKLSAKNSIYFGYAILFALSSNVFHFFKFSKLELIFLNIVALLELVTILLIIAMHNFSLSLLISLVYVPCVSFISTESTWAKKFWCHFYLLLIHPFVLIHVIIFVYTYISQGLENLNVKAFSAVQNSMIYLVMDEKIYGNWLIQAIFGFCIPNWVLFWIYAQSAKTVLD